MVMSATTGGERLRGGLRRKRLGGARPIRPPESVGRRLGFHHAERVAAPLPLRPLVAEYTEIFGSTRSPVTRRKHRDDFARFIAWLELTGLPVTTASFEFLTMVAFVEDLRRRPKVSGVWRGAPHALARTVARGPVQTLSANTVHAYVRPLRSLCIWLVDEGALALNPFRRSRRRAALNPLLPSEETPTKSATLQDLKSLERGCAGDRPLDLRDQAIVSVLVTTAARNSSVRLLRVSDLDFERSLILFRRAKGGKTLQVALHADSRLALTAYLESGRAGLLERAGLPAAAGDGTNDGLLFRPPLPPGSPAAVRQRPVADADPPLSRGWWQPALLRVTPDPARHRDAAREQRDAARGSVPLPRPQLDDADPPIRAADARDPRAAGGRCAGSGGRVGRWDS